MQNEQIRLSETVPDVVNATLCEQKNDSMPQVLGIVKLCDNNVMHVLPLSFDVIAGHFERRPSSRTAF